MTAKRILLLLFLLALALGGALVGAAFYLFRPYQAEAWVQGYVQRTGLALKEAPYGLELLPKTLKALFAFYPGARVEPLAYAPVLVPLAESGYLVVLLKVPQGIALLGKERALEAQKAHPGLPLAVGGHSLGGVVAAEVAAREGLPLVLFAAYPRREPLPGGLPHPGPLRDRRWPPSPRGSPGEGEKASQKRPGGLHPRLNHAGFGAYGPQRGDRPAQRPREELFREVAEEVLLFLESLGWDTLPPPQALR